MAAAVVLVAGCSGSHESPQADPSTAAKGPSADEHAVLIHITPPENPDEFGLDLIEDPLDEALDGSDAGELDGNEIGPEGAVIYLYGPDADRLYAAIEPVLRAAPVPAGSYAVRRYGGPGARETRLPLR